MEDGDDIQKPKRRLRRAAGKDVDGGAVSDETTDPGLESDDPDEEAAAGADFSDVSYLPTPDVSALPEPPKKDKRGKRSRSSKSPKTKKPEDRRSRRKKSVEQSVMDELLPGAANKKSAAAFLAKAIARLRRSEDSEIVDSAGASSETSQGLLRRLGLGSSDSEKSTTRRSKKSRGEKKSDGRAESESFGSKRPRVRHTRTVVQIDGRWVSTTRIKGHVISEPPTVNEYPTEQEALKAALKLRRSNSLFVWHTRGQQARSIPLPRDVRHDKAVEAWALEKQESLFPADTQVLRTRGSPEGRDEGRFPMLFLSIHPDSESDEARLSSSVLKKGVIPGAHTVGVGTDNDGIWVRIGWDESSIALVHRGILSQWESLGVGVGALTEKIGSVQTSQQTFHEVERLRAEFYTNLTYLVNEQIANWHLREYAASRIWVHGPGVEASGQLTSMLTRRTGLICLSAPVGEYEISADINPVAWIPSALNTLEGRSRTGSIFSLKKRARRKKNALIGTAVLLLGTLVGGLWWQSNKIGANIEKQIAEMELRRETALEAATALDDPLLAIREDRADLLVRLGFEDVLFPPDVDDSEIPTQEPPQWPNWDGLWAMMDTWQRAGRMDGFTFFVEQASPTADNPDLNVGATSIVDRYTFELGSVLGGPRGDIIFRNIIEEWITAVWGPCSEVGGLTAVSIADVNLSQRITDRWPLDGLSKSDYRAGAIEGCDQSVCHEAYTTVCLPVMETGSYDCQIIPDWMRPIRGVDPENDPYHLLGDPPPEVTDGVACKESKLYGLVGPQQGTWSCAPGYHPCIALPEGLAEVLPTEHSSEEICESLNIWLHPLTWVQPGNDPLVLDDDGDGRLCWGPDE